MIRNLQGRKDESEKRSVEASSQWMDEEDGLFIEKVRQWEKRHERDVYECKVEVAGVDVVLMREGQGALARLRVENVTKVEVYKTDVESGFQCFGVEMQYMNQTGVLVEFLS